VVSDREKARVERVRWGPGRRSRNTRVVWSVWVSLLKRCKTQMASKAGVFVPFP
jgi:hypothetical protein